MAIIRDIPEPTNATQILPDKPFRRELAKDHNLGQALEYISQETGQFLNGESAAPPSPQTTRSFFNK